MFGRKKREDDLEDYALDPEDQALEDAELLAIIDAQLAAEEAGGSIASAAADHDDDDEDDDDDVEEAVYVAPSTASSNASSPADVEEPEPDRPRGPWDAEDAPDDDVQRIDLGSLRLPVIGGMELRVDVNAQQNVIGATLRSGESTLSVSAFAAPRADGIWDAVRADLASSASGQGASLKETEGPFGTELAGTVAVQPPPGQTGTPKPVRRPARFIGVDGPRWFLRGMLSGPAGEPGEAAAELEDAFRQIVVVRGNEPMPVREQLPMTLPADLAAQIAAQAEAAGQQPRDA